MSLYIFALISALTLYFFNILGIDGWYAYIWWYDIFMHFLGGIVIGLWLILFFKLFFKRKLKKVHIAILALVIGLGWEIFELYYHLTGYPFGVKEYYIDTTFDLINDMLGATFAAFLVYKFSKNKTSQLP